jgi:hypothetical protein
VLRGLPDLDGLLERRRDDDAAPAILRALAVLARVAARTANGVRCGVAGSAWRGPGDLACLCFDAQEGDGSF